MKYIFYLVIVFYLVRKIIQDYKKNKIKQHLIDELEKKFKTDLENLELKYLNGKINTEEYSLEKTNLSQSLEINIERIKRSA